MMVCLYLLQVLLKCSNQAITSKSALSVQMDINIDYMQKMYMMFFMGQLVMGYVLLCLAMALYVEVLGGWVLMVAAFFNPR